MVTRTANGAIRVRLHAKVRALDMLAKHIGMYDIRRLPTSRVGDARLLTDEELIEIIREGQDARPVLAVTTRTNRQCRSGEFWAENEAQIAYCDDG